MCQDSRRHLGRRLGLVSSTSAAPQSGVVVPIHALQQQMRFISSSLVFFLPACESDLTVLHTFSHAQSLQGILYTRKPPLDLLHTPKNLSIVVTPRACARGKVIGFVCLSVCLSVIVITKIDRSRVLSINACCNYHELVDIGKNLISVHFELLNMAH